VCRGLGLEEEIDEEGREERAIEAVLAASDEGMFAFRGPDASIDPKHTSSLKMYRISDVFRGYFRDGRGTGNPLSIPGRI
jgi:hypothetical protein